MNRKPYNINGSNYSDFNTNDLETIWKNNQEMLRNMQNRVLPEHKERLNYDNMDRNLEVPHNSMYTTYIEHQPNQQSTQQYQQRPHQPSQNVSILDRALDVNQHKLPNDFNGRLEYDNEISRKDTRNEHQHTNNNNLFYGANGSFK